VPDFAGSVNRLEAGNAGRLSIANEVGGIDNCFGFLDTTVKIAAVLLPQG